MMHEEQPGYRDYVEVETMREYMEDIRTDALNKLTLVEIAALFRDFEDFQIRWHEQKEIELAETYLD
jgi:hypothetical protein